jgi:hypothetical protein
VTFEQWWKQSTEGSYLYGDRANFVACWNAALDAALTKKLDIGETGDEFFFDGTTVMLIGEQVEALKV